MATTTAPPSKRPARRRSNGDTGLLQQREAELAAMVARQAATTEILKAMSASPDDPQPVFELIAHYGLELCRSAQRCSVCEHIDGMLHVRAHHGHDAVNVETLRQHWPRPVSVDTVHGRVVLGGRIVRVRDVETDDATEVHSRDLARAFGSRSLLGVPLRGGGNTIGSLVVSASEADAFDEREVALLESFAEQAVIAITSAQTRRELAARNSAYGERIEQQAATIDVLKAMSAIASDAQPVFELITSRARELCGSLTSMLFEFDGELLHLRAWGGYDPEAAQDYLRQFPARPNRGTAVGRAILERDIVHIRNIAEDPEIAPSVRTMGVRSTVGIPLLRNRQPIGVIAIGSTTTEGFSDSQIELLKTFAEQAVIAIGSVATFRTLQQRTAELAARNSEYSERIEHQSATIDVLKAMSASPGDPQPVFDLITRRAREICSAPSAGLLEFDGKLAHFRSLDNDDSIALDDAFDAYKRLYPMAPTRSSIVCRAILDRSIVHIRDMESEAEIVTAARNIGHKSVLAVPFIRDGAAAGVIALNAWEKGGFSDSQVELLKTFAEQAVIAIRSAETFRALQQRTRDLSESLDQQTALADVLRAINASPGDPAPVFQLILEKAHSLCGATRGCLFLYDGTHIRGVATHGYPDEISAVLRQPNSPVASTISFLNGERFHHLHDIKAQTELETNVVAKTIRDLSDVRTNLVVPLRKDGTLLGLISANRTEVRPYTASEITLLENFAAQAVIAMENARLLTELRESLEQQTATAEILQVINANPGNLAPVFAALLGKAAHLCRATYGSLLTFDGERFLTEAYHGNPDFDPAVAKPRTPEPGSALARIAAGERIVHILDVADTDEYRNRIPSRVVLVEKFGARTTVWVALRKDDAVLGTAAFYRKEVRAFSDNEIALLQNFAAQAVIAIENARLLTEQREALEQQTATAEVLQVINASPGNLTPVFDVILKKAHTLCGAAIGSLMTFDGEYFRAMATHGLPERRAALVRQPFRPTSLSQPLVDGERFNHVLDVKAVQLGRDDALMHDLAERTEVRTSLLVSLRKEATLLGYISAFRHEVRSFSEKDIALLESFAAQAVIAMENARLLTEQRESLEQQTATAEVLKVISRSAFNLQTVLDTLIDSAVRLCGGNQGAVFLRDGELFRVTSVSGPPELLEFLQKHPLRAGHETATGRVALTGMTQNIPDIRADAEFSFPGLSAMHHYHSTLGVPLLRDGKVEGVLILNRSEKEPFTDRQVEMVTTFADQAVIAIENARLFDAVQKRTQELAQSVAELQALEEVLRAVNSSLDLQTVLATIISRAVPLAQADEGTIYEFDAADEVFVPKAAFGMSADRIARLRDRRIRLGATFLGRSAIERRPIHVADIQQDPSTPEAAALLPGIHAALAVPLLQGEKVIGGMVIRRRSEAAFSPTTVTQMQTFAGQSVLAIENARLFQDAERARAAAESALADLRRAQDRLVQSEKMASLGQLTAGIAHEIKNPLNFINNFSALSTELIDELRGVLANAAIDGPTRAEVDELSAMIKGNLEKVEQHGKRADGIVRNMLLHARESGGERRSVDLNATIEEALNLAYHGARAEKPGFNITLEQKYNPAVGAMEIYPQEFTRVMLNLFSNGFYAATRKAHEGAGADFQPTLTVTTEARPAEVLVRVRDNGTGIPDSARARLFEPFFTTKPAGEGTGLGLSLSHDIVVKQHGGSIAVDSRVGDYTEFTITLPRT